MDRPDPSNGGHAPPPPGQGYYASIPDDQQNQAPGAPSFAPPPTQPYDSQNPPPPNHGYMSPPPQASKGAHNGPRSPNFSPPPSEYSINSNRDFEYGGYGQPPPSQRAPSHYDDPYRPYAPADPRPHPGNMMEPYNDEKAYAEYTSAYGPPPGSSAYSNSYNGRDRDQHRPSRPPTDWELGRDGRYGRHTNDSEVSSYDDRRRSRRGYDDRDRRDSHERDSRDRDSRKPPKSNRDILRQGDGERGLASTILGGAAGAWIGHEAGRGPLGTLGGLAVGAIGANVLEKQVESYREKKRDKVDSSNPDVWRKGDRDGGRRRSQRREKSRGRRSDSEDSYGDGYDAPPRRSVSGRRR